VTWVSPAMRFGDGHHDEAVWVIDGWTTTNSRPAGSLLVGRFVESFQPERHFAVLSSQTGSGGMCVAKTQR